MDQAQLLYFIDDHTGLDRFSDLHSDTVSLGHSQDPKQGLLISRLPQEAWAGDTLFTWGQAPLLGLGKSSWLEWEDRAGF